MKTLHLALLPALLLASAACSGGDDSVPVGGGGAGAGGGTGAGPAGGAGGGVGGGASFACTGTAPAHASLCPGDEQGLSAQLESLAVASCTDERKCEYQCDPDYLLQGGECVANPEPTNVCEATGGAHCYYLAPNGDDANDGSITAPFASTNPIIDTLEPGDFVYFRGGAYGAAAKGQIADYVDWLPPYYAIAYIQRSGEEGAPITFKAYPEELPVFDMYAVNPEYDPTSLTDGPNDAFHLYQASYIVISGLEIVHSAIHVRSSASVWIEGNHVHDLLADRDNNGLVMLYFAEDVHVRNNELHDTYSRSIPDGSGGWVLNTTKDEYDAQHNGCITTLSGDEYVGYGNETSGPFELTGNDIHDCPVHLFIKNPQGELVDADGLNMVIRDNYFHGTGHLAEWFEGSNVLFENNLFKDIDGISGMGREEAVDDGGSPTMMNEISARNVTFQHNVFTSASMVVQMLGQGFLLANGVYSTAPEDKLKFLANVVVISDGAASEITDAAGSEMGWNQGGVVFGNSYQGQLDPGETPSKTLSRIDSEDNCFINSYGANLAFLKHWVNGSESITGYNHASAESMYGIDGSGDLFPADTSAATHFTDPGHNDYSIKAGSPCAAISGVGLLDPGVFAP